jgi:hypothetical protein
MLRRFTPVFAAIAGVGLIGTIALLTFLFGDNVLGRTYSFFSRSQSSTHHAEQDRSRATHIDPEPQSPEPTPASTPKRTSGLLSKICSAKRLSVTFPMRRSDPRRYQRRAGVQIVDIPNCAENDGFYDGKGIVAGTRLEFKYRYTDAGAIVDCRVVAVEAGPRIDGSVACESSFDAMDVRHASVEISPDLGSP